MTLASGETFGPYEIRGLLGRGGMGEVYLAWDTRLRREVALKLLPEGAHDEVARRRLLAEARHGARLDHPNVCAIHEVGEHEGRDFIAMQRIQGVTLEDRLARGPLPETEVIGIAFQVGEALAHAHAQGVLHRDLKPANVMVTPEGRAIVLDFGIARAADPAGDNAATATLTVPGAVAGTPSAMSPEQARGEPLDARTDVFSFGTMLHRMLTGRDPFAGPTPADAIAAVLTREPAPLPAATSAELSRIVHKCLEKDRGLRYGSMREIVVDLERLRRGSTAAVAVAPKRRLRATARRAAVAALILAVAAVVAFAVWKPGRGAREVRTLAVLPFRPLAEGEDKSYLGLGIADALISRVSQDPDLVVRPTSSVRRYATDESSANAGRELRVDAVLEGTWLQEGGQLRVTANLLRVADGASLWSDRFDAASGDLFAVQDEISERLAERLRMRLAGPARTGGTRGGTRNAQAYETYSKGLYYFSERGFSPDQRGNSDQATLLFAEAARLDPQFARAHAQLAYSLVWTALFIDQDSTLIERAQAELAAAERLEPTLGLVPLVRSQMLYSRYMGWRMEEGIAQLERARALDPSLGALETSDFAIHLGLVDEWRKGMDRALEEDPTNRRIRMTYTHNAYLLSLPELFLKLQKDLLGEQPDYRYWFMMNDVAHFVPDVERYALEHPSEPTSWVDVAAARAMQGRCREADSLLRVNAAQLPRDRHYHHVTYEMAQTQARCGNAAEAVRWLEETVRWGFPCYPLFARDPWLEPIRKSPEFVAFMERLKPDWERMKAAFEKAR